MKNQNVYYIASMHMACVNVGHYVHYYKNKKVEYNYKRHTSKYISTVSILVPYYIYITLQLRIFVIHTQLL